MANVKITDMTPGAALDGTEQFEAVQAAGTVSLTTAQVKTWASKGPVIVAEAVGSSGLTLTGATQVASFPVLSATQTWNNVAVTFTAWKLNVTSTASAAASLLADLQVGGVSQWSVSKAGAVTQVGSQTFSAAAAGPVLKQGANGRVGTFVLNGATPVTVSNTSVAISDAILFSLNTVGGTVGAHPTIQTITGATGFTVQGTAGDTSTMNYCIIKNAA